VSETIASAARLHPDVIVMDVRLPDGNGIMACREIRAAHPQTRVLFLTSFPDEEAILATVMAGADGFLLKDVSSSELVRAVKTVAAGKSFLDTTATHQVLARLRAVSAEPSGKDIDLSPQERRILALVATGQTNKEIAVALNLSQKTVSNYLQNIFQKLHVSRRSQAAVYFTQHFPNLPPDSNERP